MSAYDEASTFDRLRAFASGTMPLEERDRFERELAADPELAVLAGQFDHVWSATEAGLGVPAESRSTFDDVVSRGGLHDLARSRWRRRAAAAAALLIVGSALAWAAWKSSRPSARAIVELRAIPSSAPAAATSAEIPAVLASWSPVENGQIRWLESLDEARAVSAAVKRPIFVYGYVESCPICRGFQAREFQDPAVLALVEQAVPVRIDLLALEEPEMQELWERRYPLLEIQDEHGAIVRTFPGQFADVDMAGELASALVGIAGPNWRLVRDLAQLFEEGRTAEEGGAYARAAQSFERLEQERELPAFVVAGEAGLARVGRAAEELLERTRAGADRAGALERFEGEIAAFAGTPFEGDLAAVAGAWRERGRFPELRVQR